MTVIPAFVPAGILAMSWPARPTHQSEIFPKPFGANYHCLQKSSQLQSTVVHRRRVALQRARPKGTARRSVQNLVRMVSYKMPRIVTDPPSGAGARPKPRACLRQLEQGTFWWNRPAVPQNVRNLL
jgi:hypothetical protein